MYGKHLIKKSISLGFFIYILLILSLPTTFAEITEIQEDGIWTDNFIYNTQEEAQENLTIVDCYLNETFGIVTLEPQTVPRTYNFKGSDFEHKASVYRSILFLPNFLRPDRHIGSEFDNRAYNGIKELGGESTTRETIGIYSYIIQEYRFQLSVGPDSVGDIYVYWNGSAENYDTVELYYFRYKSENNNWKYWQRIASESTDDNFEFNNKITSLNSPLAVMENNYFYICVVATSSNRLQTCSLTVDYVEISSKSEKAWDTGPGIIKIKNPIEPESEDFYWEMLTWSDYEPDRTKIKYHMFYDKDKDGIFNDYIPDEFFSSGSNSEGFTSAPVYLNKIPTTGSGAITKIKIQANLTSETDARTPKLYSWTVTWQKEKDVWQDSFNYPYRIGSKSKINVNDGSINISSLQGEWPMFGYNSQNTRATDGKGPQSSSQLKWYSDVVHLVGGGFRNPVIGDDYLYVFNNSNDVLCKFNIQASASNSPITQQVDSNIYMNSPAITEDYIIIASGDSGEGGAINLIKGLNKNLDLEWKYKYDDGYICYYSSPVVYQNKVFITSWGGDTKRIPEHNENKVLCLDLDKSSLSGEEMLLWEYSLPAGSFSTPAVYNDIVYVGCKKGSQESFFALDAYGNGDGTTNVLWSASVGAIGRSSPVVYDDTVFVTSIKNNKIQITALNIDGNSTDRILWQKTIDKTSIGTAADITPAIYNGVLYTAAPRGTIYAIDTSNGDILWSTAEVYNKGIIGMGLTGSYLTSSPVYADGFLYIGTPAGKIYALDTRNEGEVVWTEETFQSENFVNAPVFSSPIVSNGILFVCDELGVLYAFGTYEELNKEMEGSFTSIPIKLPTGNWWGRFNVNYTSESGSNVEFSILDNEKKSIKKISNGDSLSLGSRPDLRTIYLRADLKAENMSVNPIINYWNVTFIKDESPPEFVIDSFKPNPDGWLNTPTPVCSIEVWDNQTGLRLSNSIFTITYDTIEKYNVKKDYTPEYSGENGDEFSTLVADISSLNISNDIVNLSKIEFEIRDFGDNVDKASFEFKQDTTKPTSYIKNETNGSEFTSRTVKINAVANDKGDENTASGIKSVKLLYRYSSSKVPSFSGDWLEFGTSNSSKPSWDFTPKKGGGHYELATIATDVSNNVEDEPGSGDVTFIFDNEPPEIKDDLSKQNWFKEKPKISLEFSDDFLLDTIKYKMPEFGSEWITIKSGIFKSTYDSEWDLDSSYWNQMENGQVYSIDFWISDYLENIQVIDEDGYKIVKDADKPVVDVEVPKLEADWDFEDSFIISAFASDGDGSGIKSVELFYRYSKDGNFKGDWISYGVLTSEPFEWEFIAEEKNGYYEFKIIAEDHAGNSAESDSIPLVINVFPTVLTVAMVALIVVLITIVIFMYIKWRKK